VLQFAVGHAAIRAVTLGMFGASVVSIGVASWIPSLLMRVHQLPVQRAGAATALAVGLCGGLGALTTAWIASRYAHGRPDRLLRLCGTGLALSVPAGLAGALASSAQWALAGLSLWAFASTMFIGPGHSLYLGWAPARMRGTLAAIIIVGCNLLGAGLGPQVVGTVSDLLRAGGDGHALPHGIACLALLGTLPSLLFLRAARRPLPPP
jgi:MFS family permease